MATAVQFEPAPDMTAKILGLPGVIPTLRRAAQHVAGEAERYAPREPLLKRGRRRHYADMIGGYAGIDGAGHPIGRVNAFHFTSHWVEFGTLNMAPHAPLRKGLDASRGNALT